MIKKYIVIMYGTTGEFRQEYKTLKDAEKAANNIALLGYDCEIVEQ